MDQTPKPLDPMLHTATRSASKIITIIIIGIIAFNAGILILLGGAFAAFSYEGMSHSENAEAIVTRINNTPSSDGDETRYCTFDYSFEVGSKRYSGSSAVKSRESCNLQIGSITGIKYDKQAPTNNSPSGSADFYVGVVLLSIGAFLLLIIVVILIACRMASKRSDRNNDGLFNDGMPATTAQLNVIESGMRDLGEFWVPRTMTQQEARDVIKEINAKLTARSQKPSNPES